MLKVHLETRYADEQAVIKKGKYGNGDTALVAFDAETGEPLSKITVSLEQFDEHPRSERHVFIKDYEENEGTLKCLQDNEVIGPVLRTIHMNFCDTYEVEVLAFDEIEEL